MREETRPAEHARVGLLDEVLGILARAAERPRGAVETIDVVSDPGRIEGALGRPVPAGRNGSAMLEADRDLGANGGRGAHLAGTQGVNLRISHASIYQRSSWIAHSS